MTNYKVLMRLVALIVQSASWNMFTSIIITCTNCLDTRIWYIPARWAYTGPLVPKVVENMQYKLEDI